LVGAFIALHERQRSGLGQIVDVALTEALFTMLESILPEYGQFGVVRERTGNIAHNSAPTNAYPCKDGESVCIAANTTRLSMALFRAIGRDDYLADPELGTDRGRVRRAGELDDAIAAWTRTRSADTVVATLRELEIPVSRINSIADIVADPQFSARDMVVSVDDPRLSKPLLVPGIAPKLSRTPGQVPSLAPPLGADTDAVRARLEGADTRPGSTADELAHSGRKTGTTGYRAT
jgi:formyl-CoA transferase